MAGHKMVLLLLFGLLCNVGCSAQAVKLDIVDSQYNHILNKAKAENKNVFVLVGASWCGPCHHLKDDAARLGFFKNVLFYEIDADQNKEWSKQVGIRILPTYFLVDKDGRILKRQEGYRTPNDVIGFLR